MHFPPIENLVVWPAYFGEGTIFEFNKIALITLLSMLIPTVVFLVAKKDLVPTGLQHVTEGSVTFIQKQGLLPAIGPAISSGTAWANPISRSILAPMRKSRSSSSKPSVLTGEVVTTSRQSPPGVCSTLATVPANSLPRKRVS